MKAKDYIGIVKITNMQDKLQEQIEDIGNAGLSMTLMNLIELEKSGGVCIKCTKPWKKIEVKNQFADFYYFNPDCKCYPKCPICGHSLHREMTMYAVRRCQSCGWKKGDTLIEAKHNAETAAKFRNTYRYLASMRREERAMGRDAEGQKIQNHDPEREKKRQELAERQREILEKKTKKTELIF